MRLPALGLPDRPRHRPQQGRLVPAHAALPRSRPRQRDRGRARLHHRAPQQRAQALRRRMGTVLRGRARSCQPVSRCPLCRSRLVARGPGAVCRLQRRWGPSREPLLPHLPLPAAARPRGTRAAADLRAHRGRGAGARRSRPARVLPDRDRPRRGAALRHPAGGRGARRCRDARLPARHHLDPASPDHRAADPRAPRRHPVRHAVPRRHRAEARRPARARAHGARFPERHDAGPARCLERSGLCLPLGDALDRPGQDPGDQDSHAAAAPVVCQAQVGGGHPARGDVQPRERARRSRRRQQGDRRPGGAGGAGRRRRGLRLPHHRHRRLRRQRSDGQRQAPRRRAHRQRPRLCHHPRDLERRGGLARLASRQPLRQRAPAHRAHPEPRAHDAGVGGVGRAGDEPAPQCTAADDDRDAGEHAVPARSACRRRRAHPGRRPDRRRQVGAPFAARPAVPPLHRRAGDPVRPWPLGARRHPRHGRRQHRAGPRRHAVAAAARPHRRARRDRLRPAMGDGAAHQRGRARDARREGRGVDGAAEPRPRRLGRSGRSPASPSSSSRMR